MANERLPFRNSMTLPKEEWIEGGTIQSLASFDPTLLEVSMLRPYQDSPTPAGDEVMGQVEKKSALQIEIERQRLNSQKRRIDDMLSRIEEEAKQRKSDGPRGGDSDDEPNPLDTIAKNQITILDQLTDLQKQIEQLKWITKDVVTVQGREDRCNKRIELALEIVRVLGNHQGSDKQELVGLAVMVLRDEITPLVLDRSYSPVKEGTREWAPANKGPIVTHDPTLKTYEEGVAQKYPLKEVPSW